MYQDYSLFRVTKIITVYIPVWMVFSIVMLSTSNFLFVYQRKSALKERMNANGSGEAEADSSAPEEDDKEVNLDNFMTLDSVGDVDGMWTVFSR